MWSLYPLILQITWMASNNSISHAVQVIDTELLKDAGRQERACALKKSILQASISFQMTLLVFVVHPISLPTIVPLPADIKTDGKMNDGMGLSRYQSITNPAPFHPPFQAYPSCCLLNAQYLANANRSTCICQKICGDEERAVQLK